MKKAEVKNEVNFKSHECIPIKDFTDWDNDEFWDKHDKIESKWMRTQFDLYHKINDPEFSMTLNDILVENFKNNYPRPDCNDLKTLEQKSENLNLINWPIWIKMDAWENHKLLPQIKERLHKDLRYIHRITFLNDLNFCHFVAITLALQSKTTIVYLVNNNFDQANNWILAQALAISENIPIEKIRFETLYSIKKFSKKEKENMSLFYFDDISLQGDEIWGIMENILTPLKFKHVIAIVPIAFSHPLWKSYNQILASDFQTRILEKKNLIFVKRNEGKRGIPFFDHKLEAPNTNLLQMLKIVPPYKDRNGFRVLTVRF